MQKRVSYIPHCIADGPMEPFAKFAVALPLPKPNPRREAMQKVSAVPVTSHYSHCPKFLESYALRCLSDIAIMTRGLRAE